MLTRDQRLARQHEEDTGGYYVDPTLDERNDQADEEFRHWDTYTFAQRVPDPAALKANGGESALTQGSPPHTFARAADDTAVGGCGRANGGAAVDGDDLSGTPTNVPGTTPPAQLPVPGGCAGSEVEGSSCPPMPLGLASSIERWMWTP